MKEVAHDCVAALRKWFAEKGIRNSYDTWHGRIQRNIGFTFSLLEMVWPLSLSEDFIKV